MFVLHMYMSSVIVILDYSSAIFIVLWYNPDEQDRNLGNMWPTIDVIRMRNLQSDSCSFDCCFSCKNNKYKNWCWRKFDFISNYYALCALGKSPFIQNDRELQFRLRNLCTAKSLASAMTSKFKLKFYTEFGVALISGVGNWNFSRHLNNTAHISNRKKVIRIDWWHKNWNGRGANLDPPYCHSTLSALRRQ